MYVCVEHIAQRDQSSISSSMFNDIAKVKNQLKPTQTKGDELDIKQLLDSEPCKEQDQQTREYFFSSGVDKWYDNLDNRHTFRSQFIEIQPHEAEAIIEYWKQVTSRSSEVLVEIPSSLENLVRRIDDTIQVSFPSSHGVFVKLSTRSPKDSNTIFRKATSAFYEKLNTLGNPAELHYNDRMCLFSEEMVRASAVRNGTEAVTILLDSMRAAEDLMYAYEEGDIQHPLSLVIREWEPRITPRCEFRGFVWNKKLNCVGQYWHSLFFPGLEDEKNDIADDCLAFFEQIRESLPIPNAMLDLAWLGPGHVVLIEVNPLMEGLGSFKGSTGLFDYYEDEGVLTGKQPFEIRVRTEIETRESIVSHMSMKWRSVIFGN